jgi:hypothetical protein
MSLLCLNRGINLYRQIIVQFPYCHVLVSPTALSTFNVEILSITSCSQTSISERTFKHLQSKSGKTLFSSFKLDIEEKYLFKISAFSMDSYDNLKSFCGSDRSH